MKLVAKTDRLETFKQFFTLALSLSDGSRLSCDLESVLLSANPNPRKKKFYFAQKLIKKNKNNLPLIDKVRATGREVSLEINSTAPVGCCLGKLERDDDVLNSFFFFSTLLFSVSLRRFLLEMVLLSKLLLFIFGLFLGPGVAFSYSTATACLP